MHRAWSLNSKMDSGFYLRPGAKSGNGRRRLEQVCCDAAFASLPANTVVLATFAPAVCDPDEIHKMLAWLQTVNNACKFRVFVTDHDGLCMIQYCVDSIHHEPGNVRNTVQDEVAVGADQASHFYVAVENTQVVTFADQVLDDLNHRTFAQIVGSRFETESEDTNLPLALFGY